MTFKRVLLTVGPDDKARIEAVGDATVNLCAATDATVYLLYTFRADNYESVLDAMDVDATTTELPPDELARRHDQVRILTERFEADGIDYEIRTTVGGAAPEQILNTIDRLEVDIAVIGGRKRSPAGKAMFGDRAQQVLLNAPCPVLYVKGTTADQS